MERFGGPEVLEWVEAELGEPGPGEARVAHRAVGVNFIDNYHRTGLYPVELPSGLGTEGSGVVVSVGPDVDHVAPGDQVAYASPSPPGSYSQERIMPAKWLNRLPDSIDHETAAAMMLKGMTCWYLLRRTYRVRSGDWLLIYAAAGGVGTIATQWAQSLGAHVIGVVGSEQKRTLALAQGCEHVLLADSDIVGQVRDITAGEGVPVVYDSVGRETLYTSLKCLRPRGLLVSFGNASGPVDSFNLLDLVRHGSLYVTRPSLWHYVTTREQSQQCAGELFAQLSAGNIKIQIGQRFGLRDAADAHRALEARQTTGSTVLIPDA